MKAYKAYIVTAEINGGTTYLVESPNDTFNPTMHGGGDKHTATLFAKESDALDAIDNLRHRTGKLCRVLRVEVSDQ